jgi:hypothetical protein
MLLIRSNEIKAILWEQNGIVNPSTPRPEGQGLLRVDPEWRFSTLPSKARLGAAEWVNKYLNELDFLRNQAKNPE